MEPEVAPQPQQPLVPEPEVRTVALPLPAHPVRWTYALLVANVLVWLAMIYFGWTRGLGLSGSENGLVLLVFGAKYGPAIAIGQYWRLLTACFLHIGPLHLLFNSWALFSFGQQLERRYGGARFIVLYLLAGVAGNVLSYLGSQSLSAGASGAIFGLLGASIAYLLTYRDQFGDWGRKQLTNMLVVAGYNLVIGMTLGGIDNLGHVGGLVAGLALGWGFCPRYKVQEPSTLGGAFRVQDVYPRRRALLVVVALAVLLLLLTLLATRAYA